MIRLKDQPSIIHTVLTEEGVRRVLTYVVEVPHDQCGNSYEREGKGREGEGEKIISSINPITV